MAGGVMAIIKISKATVDKLAPGDKAYIAFDAALKGFGVRVLPSGSMAYIVEYRPGAGGRNVSKKRVTIGSVGVLTPDEARREARTMLADIARGADPAAGRKRERTAPTFEAFTTAYLDEADAIAAARPAEARLRPRTIANYRSLLAQHLGPAFGSQKLDTITAGDVGRLHARLGKTKPATANRCLELIGSIFREAAKADLVAEGTNPARNTAAYKEVKRERYLTAAELIRLGEVIREAETIGLPWELDADAGKPKHRAKAENQRTRIDPDAATAIRLIIMTGARLREILHARWADVDLERGIVFVTGKTGRRPVILPAPAIEILSSHPRREPYLFPGGRSTAAAPSPRSDLKRPWEAISKAAGLKDVRIHDLRHSFASFAAAGGASLPIIGRLLGHTQPATTQRYSHLADDPLRAVADRVGQHVASALSGAPAAEVIPMRRGGA